MEEDASEVAHRYRILVEYSYDGVAMLDGAGRILYACPSSERILGFKPEDLHGKAAASLIHPDEFAEFAAHSDQVDTPVPVALRVRHRDGYWRWLEVVGRNLLSDPEVGAVVVNFRDIHDRKAAEERMLEHSAHFRLLVEGARDYAMMLVDREGRITSWNPGAERILGYAEEEILGRPIGLFFTPEDRARGMDRQELETAARTGRSLVERWHVRKDGSRFFAAGVLSAVPGAGEGPKAFTTILSDVTEKRLAEEALLRSQKRFAELVDSIDAIVWEADGATRERTFVSRKARKILGLPAEALLGPADRWEDRIVPPDRWRMREKWAESVRQGLDFVQEYRMLSDQGRRVWLRDHASAIQVARRSTYRGVAVDVTPLKNAEIRLRLQYEVTRILASETSVEKGVLSVLETAARDLEWDFAGLRLAGTHDEGPCRIFHWHSGEERLRAFVEALEREGGGKSGQAMAWPFSEAQWVSDLSSLSHDEDDPSRFSVAARSGLRTAFIIPTTLADRPLGSMEFYSLENRDSDADEAELLATVASQVGQYVERNRAEAALKVSDKALRQAQKMEAIGRLAGGVAHDFNNLLTAINGYSELLLGTVEEGNPLRKGLEEIRKAGERAASLTRQLLAFGRRQMLVPKRMDLNSMVRDMEAMLRRILGNTVDLTLSLLPDLGPVRADPTQLQQVILNLVVNARDALPLGGTVRIKTAKVSIPEPADGIVGEVLPGEYSMLAVSDNGTGMEESVKARIFEPFFTTKPPGKGTGLGLSMVDGVIRQSGGYVSVESEPGKGTSIAVYLPRVVKDAAPLQAEGRQESGAATISW